MIVPPHAFYIPKDSVNGLVDIAWFLGFCSLLRRLFRRGGK